MKTTKYLNTFCPTHNRRMVNGPVDIYSNRQVEICYGEHGTKGGICGTMLIDRRIVNSIAFYRDGKFYTVTTKQLQTGRGDKLVIERGELFELKVRHAANVRANRGAA